MNRRELLKTCLATAGMSEGTTAAFVTMQPTDVILLETTARLSQENVERMRDVLQRTFPNHKCIVLMPGFKMHFLDGKLFTNEELLPRRD
jgi:hypothetical protein